MKINDDNLAWAIRRLKEFSSGWRGFPTDEAGIMARARSFLRLVHNQTVREIVDASCGGPPASGRYPLDPGLNDADWILDIVRETMDHFPLPVEMREIYERKLPPESDVLGDPRYDYAELEL